MRGHPEKQRQGIGAAGKPQVIQLRSGNSTAPLAIQLREAPLRMTDLRIYQHLLKSYMSMHSNFGVM
jgi:hypothetical protein